MQKPLCISYARFSRPEQMRGDSLRRQIENARQYAAENGLQYDESYVDKGLSGWSGKHIEKGYLGKFLKMVNDGEIPVGSVLVIENLDRISRQNMTTALTQFLNILDAGITIHTLMDNQTYTQDVVNKNPGLIYQSIGVMQRAHDESEAKSKRMRSAWASKRKNAADNNIPITSRLPLWLELDPETMVIKEIPDRVEVVRKIFRMVEAGFGATRIIRSLYEDNIKPWGKPKNPNTEMKWHQSYIQKILKSRTVLGEYRATLTGKDGKQVLSDQIIKNYYPAIVDEKLFDRVQTLMSNRRSYRGKVGRNCNLFSGLLKCGYCEASVVSSDRTGSTKKGKKVRRYLACSDARLNRGCPNKMVSFPTEELEKAFLTFVSEVDYADLVVDKKSKKAQKIKAKKDLILSLQNKLKDAGRAIDNYTRQLEKAPSERLADMMAKNLDKALGSKEGIGAEIDFVQAEIKQLQEEETTVTKHLNSIGELFKQLYSAEPGKDDLRYALRSEINQIIDKIVLYPDGLQESIVGYDEDSRPVITTIHEVVTQEVAYLQSEIADLRGSGARGKAALIKEYRRQIRDCKAHLNRYIDENTGRHAKAAHIYFKNGAFREICYDHMTGYYVRWDVEEPKPAPEITGWDGVLNALRSDIFLSKKKTRPLFHPDESLREKHRLIKRIIELRDSGMPYKKMADLLNGEGQKTLGAKTKWTPSNLSRVYCDYKGKIL